MKHLVLIGAGGFCRELYGHAQHSLGYGAEWDIKGCVSGGPIPIRDDEKEKLCFPLLGHFDSYEIEPDDVFACAVGTPDFRRRLVTAALERGATFISVIHETAVVQATAKLGTGIILCPYTSVNDHAEIGDYVVLNAYSGAGHDAVIGDYACIMARVGIMGGARIGEASFIGGGALILPQAKVGQSAFVGAGSVVLKSVHPHAKVFGNPAQPI